jgi:hypothetical protein
MKVEFPDVPPEQRTPVVEALLGIIRQVLDRAAQRELANQQLRDELAQRKAQKPRPEITPSVLDGSKPKSQANQGGKRPGATKRPKTAERTSHHEVPVHAADLSAGATFRCYEPFVVHERIIHNDNTRFLRARDDLPGGGSLLAPFPPGVLPVAGGHFGANVIAFILDQYHQAQVTEPLLLAQSLTPTAAAKLRQGPQAFRGADAWQARLTALAITNERHVRIATEGALLGGLVAHGVSPAVGVRSDGAPQFVLFVHAGGWI